MRLGKKSTSQILAQFLLFSSLLNLTSSQNANFKAYESSRKRRHSLTNNNYNGNSGGSLNSNYMSTADEERLSKLFGHSLVASHRGDFLKAGQIGADNFNTHPPSNEEHHHLQNNVYEMSPHERQSLLDEAHLTSNNALNPVAVKKLLRELLERLEALEPEVPINNNAQNQNSILNSHLATELNSNYETNTNRHLALPPEQMSNYEQNNNRHFSSAEQISNYETNSGEDEMKTTRCSLHGVWVSAITGVAFELQPDASHASALHVQVVDLNGALPGVGKMDFISSSWSGAAQVSPESPTTISIILQEKTENNEEPKTVSFVGQCVICRQAPIIQGVWTLFPKDQICFQETKAPQSDVMYLLT